MLLDSTVIYLHFRNENTADTIKFSMNYSIGTDAVAFWLLLYYIILKYVFINIYCYNKIICCIARHDRILFVGMAGIIIVIIIKIGPLSRKIGRGDFPRKSDRKILAKLFDVSQKKLVICFV